MFSRRNPAQKQPPNQRRIQEKRLMSDFQNILIVLDVYNDFRDNPEHQPTEVKKALQLVANRELTQLFLVGCGFEEYLHDTYSNFGPEALEHRKQFVAEMENAWRLWREV